MITIPGGRFLMGAMGFYLDEGPVVERTVRAFELDEHPVTNRQFAEFVDATGYVTVAERPLNAEEYPSVAVEDLRPGALAFQPTDGPVNLGDWRHWWHWEVGAFWRRPFGPDSDLGGKGDHPVVQVSFEDAERFAGWAGKRLPSEAEWEFACRGGGHHTDFAWGEQPTVDGRLMANTWQGRFPHLNTGAGGWEGTSPVGTFAPNGFGLVDMIGNTWEWTRDYYSPRHETAAAALPDMAVTSSPDLTSGCHCGPGEPLNSRAEPLDQRAAGSSELGSTIPRRVTKGGSHLCAPEYCLRYRPAARSPQAEDSATTHIGFRCARG